MGASGSGVLPGPTIDFLTVGNELQLDSIIEIEEFVIAHNLVYLG